MYQSVIVGGGLVGITLAIALKEERTLLIDAAPLTTKEDPRLIALNHQSICLLKNLDLWSHLAPYATPIHQIHVSHRGKLGITRIHHSEVKLPELGFLIPAKNINEVLDKKLKSLPHIEIVRPAFLKNFLEKENVITVTFEKDSSEKTIQTQKIFGADGTHSTVRQLLNIPTETIDYQQSALVTITQLQRSHDNIAYERFLEKGAIAMLPMTDNRVATIWTDENPIIKNLMELNDTEFLKTLQTHFGYRLGRLKNINTRYTFPLHLICAKKTSFSKNIILLGNALHTVHPLAAQGFNLALQEVASLAKDPTTPLSNTPITKFSHHLHGFFSTDFLLMNVARTIGMVSFDMMPFAKNYFIQKMMGSKECYEREHHA